MNLNELRAKIREASDAYYNGDEPILADHEFDALKDELKRISPDDPLLSEIGSPVSEKSAWVKATHKIPMGSLNKCNTEMEFIEWYENCGYHNLTMSEKLDGLSIDLCYERGKLVQAITRGDGVIGEDITRNVIQMKNVKINLPKAHASLDVTYNISLRGEIVFLQKDFDAVNDLLIKDGQKPLKNKRNAASGIARSLDGIYCKYLSIIYYDTTFDVKTAKERFEFIQSLGLPTSLVLADKNIHYHTEAYEEYENEKRIKLDYDIDGLVVEVDDLNKKSDLGEVYGNAKGAIAWKFGSMKAETEVVNIEWQLGNSGRITPVVIVKPIELAGVTVQKASLHNMEIFNHFSLHIGDTILVSRRNDVIPYVESVVCRNKNINRLFDLPVPTMCPVCGGRVKIDGKFLVCDDDSCSGKVSGNIKVWVKKLELKGIASATIETLCAKDMISEPSDLYYLNAGQLQKFGGFGPRISEKIIEIINSKKELTLSEFVGGLNIPQWGRRMTDLLVEAGYDTLNLIMCLQEYELIKIKGIEVKTARAFLKGIQSKKEIISNLLQAGIVIKGKEKAYMIKKQGGGKLAGKSFCFTGAINRVDAAGERFTRKKMWELVVDNGGVVEDSVKAGLSYLVMADVNSTSSKTQKAKKLGVELLSEANFFKMIGV